MRFVDGWLEYTWHGATVTQWLLAAAVFGAVYVLLSLGRRLALRRLAALASRTATQVDDLAMEIVRRTQPYFLVLIAAHSAARVVAPSGGFATVFRAVSIIVVLLQAGVWGNGLIGFGAEHYARRATGDAGLRATIQALGYGVRFALWAVLVVTALQNFGINVTALVTGLGIGGVAIALAVQNILGDLFAALAIVVDRPFVVGDAITVDNLSGTVEHVGLKTTRIRSVDGEQVVIANGDLLKSRIHNYKRMEQRRVVFSVNVAHDTPADAVARIPDIVRAVIALSPKTKFDRCHLLAFTESSLRLEAVYFILDPDYNLYADTQHAINLEIMRRFAAEKIALALPARSVFVRGESVAATVARTPQPTVS